MKRHRITQCRLVKRIDDTTTVEQTAYIPSKYAVENTVVKIKREDGRWDDGWQVMFVYNSIDDVVSARQSIKRHRKNTGDSLPKRENK